MKKHVPCMTFSLQKDMIAFSSVKVITFGQLPGMEGPSGAFVRYCNISCLALEQSRESLYVVLEQNTVCTFWSLFPHLSPMKVYFFKSLF